LRRINKSLKQCQIGNESRLSPVAFNLQRFSVSTSHITLVAKRLGLKFKNLTAE
jgi:hypothetical protein